MGSAQVQGKLWGPGARDWAELNEPCCTPFYEAVFDAIAVGPGMVMLDGGCGGGFAWQLAAKRGATVTGFDACAPLLDIARERVPAADIRQGDLESLPFAGHTFDAITAFNSVQYQADPVAALRELRRVAKPRAPVAILTWGAPERCQSRVILAAIGGLLPPPPPGAEGPFALSVPGKLEKLAEAAGLVPGAGGRGADPAHLSRPGHGSADSAVLRACPAGYRARRRAVHPQGAGRGVRRAVRQPTCSYRQDNSFRYLIARA